MTCGIRPVTVFSFSAVSIYSSFTVWQAMKSKNVLKIDEYLQGVAFAR